MHRLCTHAIAFLVSSPWAERPVRRRELYCRARAVVVYDRTLAELESPTQ